MRDLRWIRARDEFQKHLDGLDWSDQTPSRQRILEAFLRLASEHGFNSVSMRMIAQAVEIKAPSLYAHFPNGRDEIVAKSLRWHFFRFGTALMDEIREVPEARDGWERMVSVHVSRQLTLPESNLWDLLVATDTIVHFLDPNLRAEVDEWIDRYEAIFRAAAKDMGCTSPTQLVKVVMTLLEGVNRWAMWDGKASAVRRCVTKASRLSLALVDELGSIV